MISVPLLLIGRIWYGFYITDAKLNVFNSQLPVKRTPESAVIGGTTI
jgi:hypothetical protein